jgi:hypothetical protein
MSLENVSTILGILALIGATTNFQRRCDRKKFLAGFRSKSDRPSAGPEAGALEKFCGALE